MDVVAAVEGDLPALERLYRASAEEMRGTAHDVWWEFGVHPSSEYLIAEVRAGNLFVAIAGADAACERRVAGALVLNSQQGADYARIPWRVDAVGEDVAVLHLVATSPEARGRGVARGMLERAAGLARQRGARALRLDVFDNNEPAIALYRTFGFFDLGIFDIEVGGGLRHPSHLMELDLIGCSPHGLPGGCR